MSLLFYGFCVALFGAVGWANHDAKVKRQKRVKAAYQFNPTKTQAAGDFASDDELKNGGLFGGKGIRIGFSQSGKVLRYGGASHLALIAPARSGKQLTVLTPAILSLGRKYSLWVIDSKAELCSITGHYRKRFGNVYVLNPFAILQENLRDLQQARYNPFSILDTKSTGFHATCDKLAEAICPDDMSGAERHWIMSARMLVSGIIAALANFGSEADRNLVAVRNVITGANGHSVFEFCRDCMSLPDAFMRQKLGRFAAPNAEESRELNSVVSTADTCTGFIGNAAIAESLKGSDFAFRDLIRKPGTTVYVCLPLNKLDVCSAYFRLIMAAALSDLLEEGLRGKGAPVLGIIDEAAQIGPLKALTDAWGMAAGAANVQLWAIYQSVVQIMNQFGKNWQMILSCGVSIWFRAADQASRDYCSQLAGVTQVLSANRSVSIDNFGEPHVTDSSSTTLRPVIHPHEVGELGDDEMLVFSERVRGPIKAKRKPYLNEFRGKYRSNPYFLKSGFLNRLFE